MARKQIINQHGKTKTTNLSFLDLCFGFFFQKRGMLHFVCDFVEASQTQQRNNMGIGEASQIEQRNNMGIESFRVCSQKGIAMPIFVICFARRAGWSTRCSRRSTDSCCLSCLQQNLQKKSRASVFVCLFDPYSVLFDIVCFDSESFRWFLLARWMQKMLLH